MSRGLRLALMAAVVFWAACASPPVVMDPRASAQTESAESVLLIPQAALVVDVNPTYIGGGLLEQLLASYIDSKRWASAVEAAGPVTQQLEGYDLRAAFGQAWTQAFANAGVGRLAKPVRIETLEVTSPAWAARRQALFDSTTASALLFATIDCRLQSGKLVMSAKLEAYPKAAALMAYRKSPDASSPVAEGNAIYRKDFVHTKEFITANNVRRYVGEAVSALSRQVAADLTLLQR